MFLFFFLTSHDNDVTNLGCWKIPEECASSRGVSKGGFKVCKQQYKQWTSGGPLCCDKKGVPPWWWRADRPPPPLLPPSGPGQPVGGRERDSPTVYCKRCADLCAPFALHSPHATFSTPFNIDWQSVDFPSWKSVFLLKLSACSESSYCLWWTITIVSKFPKMSFASFRLATKKENKT